MDRFDFIEFDQKQAGGLQGSTSSAMPTDGPSFHAAARKMRNAGYFKDAASYFQRAVGYDEHNYSARVEWIDSLVRAGLLQEADQISFDALNMFRKVRALYASRALVLAHLGRFEEALPLSGISIEKPEVLWYARVVRGELNLLRSIDLRFEALNCFEEALACSADRWEAAFLAGLALNAAGLATWGAGYLAEAAHLNPRAPVCWLAMGDAFRSLRLFDQAAFYYERVLDLDSNNDMARSRLADAKVKVFGLVNVFLREDLQKRWRRAEERLDTPNRSSWIE